MVQLSTLKPRNGYVAPLTGLLFTDKNSQTWGHHFRYTVETQCLEDAEGYPFGQFNCNITVANGKQ